MSHMGPPEANGPDRKPEFRVSLFDADGLPWTSRLSVGPWNHASAFNDDMPTVFGEAPGGRRPSLGGAGSALPQQPVRVHIGEIGVPGRWRDLPDWPPPDVRAQPWHLHGDGTLAAGPPARTAVDR